MIDIAQPLGCDISHHTQALIATIGVELSVQDGSADLHPSQPVTRLRRQLLKLQRRLDVIGATLNQQLKQLDRFVVTTGTSHVQIDSFSQPSICSPIIELLRGLNSSRYAELIISDGVHCGEPCTR